jgi:hypothetical protein
MCVCVCVLLIPRQLLRRKEERSFSSTSSSILTFDRPISRTNRDLILQCLLLVEFSPQTSIVYRLLCECVRMCYVCDRSIVMRARYVRFVCIYRGTYICGGGTNKCPLLILLTFFYYTASSSSKFGVWRRYLCIFFVFPLSVIFFVGFYLRAQ